ncbi:sel1 repeat family protein [Moraxella sp. K127]|nr:tetratricopeptide repeat protein [Moraxella sp. K127]MBE9591321.1 sel1 repeat family protein [Moraxella sp. K127]
MKTKLIIFALIATLTGCVNQAQAQSQAQSHSCQELYLTNPQSAIHPKSAMTICQKELAQNPNNAQLQFYLGYAYDLEADYKKAVEWYTKSANQGYAKAQYSLGAMYYTGQGVPQDYAKAFELFTKSANQGYAEAEYNLGVMYYNGQGVKQDYTKALEWFTKSANQDNAKAQYNLGMMYHNGDGVKQNPSTAKQWFAKACENGHLRACQYR